MKAERQRVTVARAIPLLLLVLGKSARCASLFTAGDLLFHSQIPLPLFVEIVLALAAAVLLLMYQPWRGASRGAVLPARWPILAHGACMACTLTLWCYGLTHCGPVRTLLLDYTEPFAVFLGAAAWSATPATRGARRAAALLAGAYLLLLLTHGMHHPNPNPSPSPSPNPDPNPNPAPDPNPSPNPNQACTTTTTRSLRTARRARWANPHPHQVVESLCEQRMAARWSRWCVTEP